MKGNCYPDPGIQHGHFRVLPRTDGQWCVLDDREPPGKQTVMVFKSKEAASVSAADWHRLGHG